MARKALERADVAILIIDAVEGVTNLDANIAGYARRFGLFSVIIAVNKWDAVEEKETNTIYEFEDESAPGDEVSRLGADCDDFGSDRTARAQNSAARREGERSAEICGFRRRSSTSFLKKTSRSRKAAARPRRSKAAFSRLHVQYHHAGAEFARRCLSCLLRAAAKADLHFSYLRYIENRLREEFEFFATPIRLRKDTKQRKERKINSKNRKAK